MEKEILEKFEAQDKKLEKIYLSIEKMRKYFLFALIVTIAAIVVPLIGLAFVIPKFLNIYSSGYLGL